jgi:transposase InsO family protein
MERRSKAPKLNEYNGEPGRCGDWWSHAEEIFAASKTSEADQLAAVNAALKGQASDEFWALFHEMKTGGGNQVPTVKKVMDAVVPVLDAGMLPTLCLRFADMQQDQGESIISFRSRFQSCVRGLERFKQQFEPPVLAVFFGTKLRNWKSIAIKNPESVAAIVDYVIKSGLDEMPEDGRALAARHSPPPAAVAVKKEDVPSRRSSGAVRCYNCNKVGHKSPQCPKPNKRRNGTKTLRAVPAVEEKALAVQDQAPAADEIVIHIDSGASANMFGQFNSAFNVSNISSRRVVTANGRATATKMGSVLCRTPQGADLTISDVLHLPGFHHNLLSVSWLLKNGYKVDFGPTQVTISRDGAVLGVVTERDGVYPMRCKISRPLVAASATVDADDHARHGHAAAIPPTVQPCATCVEANHVRSPLPPRNSVTASAPLQLVHVDVAGPLRAENKSGGERYYMAIVDDYSRCCFPFLMKHKSEAITHYTHFNRVVTIKYRRGIAVCRTDNESIFTSHAFETHLRSQGTTHQLTQPHHPQQNGVVERMNRTLLGATRALLHHSGTPHKFWGEALMTAAYLRNRTPSRAIGGKSPLSLWDSELSASPNPLPLRVFGCECWALDTTPNKGKLEPRAWRGVFMGYNWLRKSYRVLRLDDKQIISSRDVRFNEKCFPFRDRGGYPSPLLRDPLDWTPPLQGEPPSRDFETQEAKLDSQGEAPSSPRYPRRDVHPPVRYGFDEFAAAAELDSSETPRNYKQAMESEEREEWKSAMQRELDSLKEMRTWTLVVLPNGKRAIKGGWVFRLKRNAAGRVVQYKARYVARGYAQRPGVDYFETYAPVAKIKSLRFVFALAAQYKLALHQIDFASAYLCGKLDEEVYIEQPEGFSAGDGLVCKLNKSLYGLKQAGRVWNQLLNRTLVQLGFRRSKSDSCVYIRRVGKLFIILTLWVDDMLIADNNPVFRNELLACLTSKFKLSACTELTWLLGMRVVRTADCIRVDQYSLCHQILERFGFAHSTPVSTPAVQRDLRPLGLTEEQKQEMSSVPYRQAIGALRYLADVSRPDIAAAVGEVSRYCESPEPQHWQAVCRIFKYLVGTKDFALEFKAGDSIQLEAFADANWGGDVQTRRSTTGYLVFSNGPVSWRSCLQRSVALSTAEAELMAVCEAACEVIWWRQLLFELGFPQPMPTTIFNDNQACIAMTDHDVNHSRAKHIELRYKKVRELVDELKVTVKYVSTKNNLADFLTKPLGRVVFNRLVNLAFGGATSSRGGVGVDEKKTTQ